MAVRSMTFIQNENQFPEEYSKTNDKVIDGLTQIKSETENNLTNSEPKKKDKDQHWISSEKSLQWRSIADTSSPDSMAIFIGITLLRTEELSFNIAVDKSEEDTNICPSIDNLYACPVEVLLLRDEQNISAYTPRKCFERLCTLGISTNGHLRNIYTCHTCSLSQSSGYCLEWINNYNSILLN